jgi:hypothetical protein
MGVVAAPMPSTPDFTTAAPAPAAPSTSQTSRVRLIIRSEA